MANELNEIVEKIKDMLDDVINPIIDVIDADLSKAYDGCGCATCKKLDVTCDKCPDCSNDMGKADSNCDCATCKEQGISCDQCEKCMSKSYESDDEEMDKWDNMEKSCWKGYKQDGMKDKNGKQVPNCVPIQKSNDEEPQEEVKKSIWDGKLDPITFAKRKFNAKERRQAAESGHAMPDGSYPINTKDDLSNAIRTFGLGGSDPKVKSHIKRRAKELGAENMIPDNWK